MKQASPTHWIDVRDIIRTDDNFRDANIDWNYTQDQSQERCYVPLFNDNKYRYHAGIYRRY